MMHENDKLMIPERYQKMSISELKREKERVYTEIRRDFNKEIKKSENKKQTVKFYF